jgi:hypothetical protein
MQHGIEGEERALRRFVTFASAIPVVFPRN